MRTKIYLMLAVGLVAVSCTKQRLEKDLDGTYTRSLPPQIIYLDSTTQVFFEATTIDFDRKNDVLAWGGNVTGREEVTLKKSSRDKKNELEFTFDSPNWQTMLPVGATPNTITLENCKFYLKPDGNTLQLSILYPNMNEIKFVFTQQ